MFPVYIVLGLPLPFLALIGCEYFSGIGILFFFVISALIANHLLDYNYLILNTLVELAKNEVFNQKAKRMLREYEQILISIVPQLCYNKLLYIITLSRINSILKSNKIQRHIKAILISITDDELLDEFNSNNMNFCAGAIGELLILKYISRDQLYIDDNLSYIKFIYPLVPNESNKTANSLDFSLPSGKTASV